MLTLRSAQTDCSRCGAFLDYDSVSSRFYIGSSGLVNVGFGFGSLQAPGHVSCRCVFGRLLLLFLIHIVSSPGFISLQPQQIQIFSRLYTHTPRWLRVFPGQGK